VGSQPPRLSSTDPNWFCSTVAQSTAAIVGLAGGFVASRLISQWGDIAHDREPLRAAFLELTNEVAQFKAEAESALASLGPVLAEAEKQQAAGALGNENVVMSNLTSLRAHWTDSGSKSLRLRWNHSSPDSCHHRSPLYSGF
jgi:hypothetical protein